FDEIIWKTGFQTGMTSSRRHPRHPATVSLDPANKQRDDESPRTVILPQTVIPRFIRGIS
ncbi:hypothetical protein, partial [Wolbachia pipientis]|uniref:hypothetical protein n=1 Tax=Wolbachia pipientis TaxID=955 RepID=UPI001C9DFDB9